MILKKIVSNLITMSFLSLIAAFSLMITACSPHSGAGNWKAEGDNSLNISRINVVFEGTADFYTNDSDGKEISFHRCFWSATGKHMMQMQCVHSDNTDKKEVYQLTVTESGQAKLTQDEQLLGMFIEMPPQEPKPEDK